MNELKIKQKAKEIQKNLGGRIFVFPINENDPYSKYAMVIDVGQQNFMPFKEELDISEAASCVFIGLDMLNKSGVKATYDEDVRFISYDAQINAPSVVMKRLKKGLHFKTVDRVKNEEDEVYFTPIGVLKYTYLILKDEKNVKADDFITKYCRLLAQRKFGGSVRKIKNKLMKMTKDDAMEFLEETYKKYVTDQDIINLMN
ncbi:hypothetical protein FQB35_10660 [Crassaminicella thermophila]|uniref:Uncharacterized protein n=1 Tax=Crassaminicella thermophila TaxID=2599308 RepID=A0A5C0SDY5_CRATE|nr:hypothetical protein [Crassaminicella thermophila]QEK12753.1 hypothetical protein FQB35_10660 [Crassaminicella thermophila]